MEISGKFWGRTSPLFCKNNVEIHRFQALQGGFSSKHCHTAKYNMFFVESGYLEVTTWKDESGKPDKTMLVEGQSCTVAPGLYHMFRALDDCTVYEIYWVELRENDIVRENSGGFSDASEN